MNRLLTAVGLVAALAAVGCAPDPLTPAERMHVLIYQNKELQFELLKRDQRIAELQGGQGRTVPDVPAGPLGGVSIDDPFRAIRIELHRLTALVDSDGRPGADALRLVMRPKDAEGDTVKRAGSLQVRLYHLGDGESTQVAGAWDFKPAELAQEWVAGFGADLYKLELPLPEGRPESGELLLRVAFTTLDGRKLTAEETLKTTGGESGENEPEPSSEGGGTNPTVQEIEAGG